MHGERRKTSPAILFFAKIKFPLFHNHFLFSHEYIQKMISKAPIFTVNDTNPFLISDEKMLENNATCTANSF